MNQRSTLRIEELAVQQVSGALHGHLARAAGDDVLVALATALGVVSGPEAVGLPLDVLERRAVFVERRLQFESVGQVVERGWCFGRIAAGTAVRFGIEIRVVR